MRDRKIAVYLKIHKIFSYHFRYIFWNGFIILNWQEDGQTQRERDRHVYMVTHTNIERVRDKEWERQKQRQRQNDRQKERQTVRERERDRERCKDENVRGHDWNIFLKIIYEMNIWKDTEICISWF